VVAFIGKRRRQVGDDKDPPASFNPTSGSARVLGLVPWEQCQQLAYRIGVLFGQRSQLWYHLPAADSVELLGTI
jgi:ABC-type uncharacterized transport system ATPase subunit